MSNILFLITMIVIILIFLSGNTTNKNAIKQEEGVKISMKNFSADKEVYHSSEVLNLTVIVYSNSNIENATAIVNGINGRLNEKRVLNLNNGINEVYFTYKLPRCNVCGGISAGDYNLSCEVTYENITINNFTVINIQQ